MRIGSGLQSIAENIIVCDLDMVLMKLHCLDPILCTEMVVLLAWSYSVLQPSLVALPPDWHLPTLAVKNSRLTVLIDHVPVTKMPVHRDFQSKIIS